MNGKCLTHALWSVQSTYTHACLLRKLQNHTVLVKIGLPSDEHVALAQ